jgi:hypothetical protein
MEVTMRSSFLAAALFAVAILAACSSPTPSVTISVGEQCQPINKYDTRCDQASATAAPSVPTRSKPITLDQSAHVRYEINFGPSGDRPDIIQYQKQTDVRFIEYGHLRKQDTKSFVYEFDASAGVRPYLRWHSADNATCRVIVDGVNVAVWVPREIPGFHACAAGPEPTPMS